MQKILIIEDDKWIAGSLKLYLENSWFDVYLCYDWAEAVNQINLLNPKLIILDINLPWKDWIQICKEVRDKQWLSIIMLTARSSELDRITWLEIWADDYIAKPFSPRELLARIHTIFRRVDKNSTNTNAIEFENLKVDLDKKLVFVDEVRINLTSNEYDLFKKILENNGKLISRETLMTEVMWYDNYLYDRTIDTHIKNLRKKIWIKDLILTVRWEWYRLNK